MQTLDKIQFNTRQQLVSKHFFRVTYPKNEAAVVAQNIEVMVSGHNSIFTSQTQSI